LGPDNQQASRSQLQEASSGHGGQESSAPKPMEIYPPDNPRQIQTVQRPVYYISEVLHDAKTRYLEVHKLLYIVLIASRKLHHYFQAHKISMVTSYPLKAVLHSRKQLETLLSGRQSWLSLSWTSCRAMWLRVRC
jgi:hypothetical protein